MPIALNLPEPDLNELLKQWYLPINSTLEPIGKGTSNTTFIVTTPDSSQFILKLYADSTAIAQIHYEHSLLAYLQQVDLSFNVPAPLPTQSGETLILVNKNDKQLRVALFFLLSGEPAKRDHLEHTSVVGKALGELHLALAGFDPKGELAQLPSWGDLYHIHPLVKDPLEITQSLGLPSNQQARLAKTLTEVLEAQPHLYRTLPFQTTHADYLCPNLLIENNQVVGVLDFEFATKDLRLMDYICGLNHFCLFPWKEASHWEFVEAFSSGYNEQVSLTQLEVEALLTAWRLQRASCIVYWTGWLREGKVTHQSVVDGVSSTLLLEDWFQENATKLLNYIDSA